MLHLYLDEEQCKLLTKEVRDLSEKKIFCFKGIGKGKTEIARHIIGLFPKISLVKEEKISRIKSYMIVITEDVEKIRKWAEGKKYRVIVLHFNNHD